MLIDPARYKNVDKRIDDAYNKMVGFFCKLTENQISNDLRNILRCFSRTIIIT
jgi:hypothetical protein